MLNDYKLNEYAQDCAREILKEVEKYGGDEYDLAHERADSSEWVIYYSKAHELCQNCNTDNGEAFIEDVGGSFEILPQPVTYDSLASGIAYGELHSRICQALDELKGTD